MGHRGKARRFVASRVWHVLKELRRGKRSLRELGMVEKELLAEVGSNNRTD